MGRDRELEVLTDLLGGARSGHAARTVLVEGEAGIGKSRLVAEALARTSGLHVLRGRADALRGHRSFGAIADALGRPDPSRGPADARLVTLLGDGGGRPTRVGPGLRAQLIDAFVAAVRARAGVGRVALVLEDLHWADEGTAAVVGELCEPVPGRDVVVIATRRGSPRPAGMRRVESTRPAGWIEVLALSALDGAAVTDLLTDLVGRPPSVELERHVARAGGNPLYLIELVGALAEEGSLATGAGGAVDLRHASLPPSLRVTLLRRLSALSDEALEALRLASLLGTSFAVEDLAVALDEPLARTVARLAEPLEAGWLVGQGSHLSFRHDLVREALHEDTPAAVRRGLHRHVADQLVAAGRGASQVAHHLLLGATSPDPAASAWLGEAGVEAASSEPRVAVELLEAAIGLDPTPGPRRDILQLDLAVARCWAGQVSDGEAVLRELLSRPHDPAIDAAAALAFARSLILSGATDEALAVLVTAEERVDAPLDRTRLVAERAICTMLRGDLPGAHEAVAQVLDADVVDAESRCVASAVRCALLALGGRFPAAIAAGEEAVRTAAASADPETVRRPPQLFLGSVLLDADRFDEGWKLLDEGRRLSEMLGAVWDLPLVHLVTARGRYLTGEHDDALTEAETALGMAAEVGTNVLEVWGHAIIAHVHLHRGDLEAVRETLAAGEAVVARVGPQVRGTDWLVWARATLADLEGHHEAARHLLAAVWEGHGARGMRSERRLFGPELVRLHLRSGDEEGAAAVAAAVEELAATAGTASATAAALHACGLVERDADRLVAAAATTARTACRTEHVAQALDAADQLRAVGRRAEATTWFERAANVARGVGMSRSSRRAEAGLRALGVRSGVRGRRGRPRTGWASLTPTERQVAELAAEGLSNPDIGERLYVSRRTVQSHLSHVYGKLGIESRVELATHVARRSLAD